MGAIHEPVMLAEVLTHLAPRPGARFLDATAGTGGHLLPIAERLLPGGLVFAVDLDPRALEVARQRLAEALAPHPMAFDVDIPSSVGAVAARNADVPPCPEVRVVMRCGNFAALTALVRSAGIEPFDGILLDLGLSTSALDDPTRGFSIVHDGRLDMRMNPEMRLTAEQVVNRYTVQELRRILRDEGEERWAGRIAAALGRRRAERPIRTTGDLAAIIARAVPPAHGRRRIHPATRTFMAIRATVNEERANLRGSP